MFFFFGGGGGVNFDQVGGGGAGGEFKAQQAIFFEYRVRIRVGKRFTQGLCWLWLGLVRDWG